MSEPPGPHPRGRELSSYLDGGLSVRRTRAVARHVEACPTCARELAALRTVKSALASQQEVEPRLGWLPQVQEQVATGARPASTSRIRLRLRLRLSGRGNGQGGARSGELRIAHADAGHLVIEAPDPPGPASGSLLVQAGQSRAVERVPAGSINRGQTALADDVEPDSNLQQMLGKYR